MSQFCTFTVDALLLGVPIAEAQEVLRHQAVTPVPRAPRSVRGLMNLRGQIIAAVDLRRRLRLAALPDGAAPMTVVVRTADGPAALLVDEIGDVVDVHDEMEPPPETLAPHVRGMTVGVHKLHEGLLLVLSADRAVAASAREA